jgi:protein-tyrosine phosphatase
VARLRAELGNFRCLEGVPCADRRRIRAGVLYRSEALVDLSPGARDALAALRIRTVCDLRSAGEVARHPDAWPGSPPHFLQLDTLPEARVAGADLIRDILADTSGDTARQIVRDNAGAMPPAFERSLRTIFDVLVDDAGVPMLINCVAGKDRTGFVVSVILLALGAPHDEILGEFMRSADAIDTARLHAEMVAWLTEPLPEMVTVETLHTVGVLPEYVDAAFATIVSTHGSLDAFLRDGCGLDDGRLARLRELVLEPVPETLHRAQR